MCWKADNIKDKAVFVWPWNKNGEENGNQANTSRTFDWFSEQHARTHAVWLVCRTKHINKMSSLVRRAVSSCAVFLCVSLFYLTTTTDVHLSVSVQHWLMTTKHKQASDTLFKDMHKPSYDTVLSLTGKNNIPYWYLFSRVLNFAKMEEANFARLKFRDLAARRGQWFWGREREHGSLNAGRGQRTHNNHVNWR